MKNDFVTVPVTLGADVANAATFTINYPAGYNAGDFSGAAGHYLSLNGSKLLQPQDITLAFGATAVTVTNGTGGVLPAFSRGAFEFEIRGKALPALVNSGYNHVQRLHGTALYGVFIDLGAPAALSANGLYSAVAVGALAAVFTVADMAATANGGVLDVPRNITAAGDGAGANQALTFYGTDEYGELVSETITLNAGNTIAGKKAFKTVTGVAVAAGGAAAHTFSAGWGNVFGLPLRIHDQFQVLAEVEAGVVTKRDVVRLGFQHTEAELDAGAIRYIAPGFAGLVLNAGISLEDVVTTGGAITYKVGATLIGGLTNVIADGAVAGTFYQDTTVTGDGTEYFLSTDYLQAIPAGAINASAPVVEWITVVKSNGRLATGLARNTKSTATTADVRGTYAPNTAADGLTSFALWVLAEDIFYPGNIQYAA